MIPYGKHHINDEDIEAVVAVLKSGALTQGQAVSSFEIAVSNYVGSKYAVAVSSGTAALHLALLASGIGLGDVVATTPITFVATANAAGYVGADVIFCDVCPETINLSPECLKKIFEQNVNVRMVIPVHYAGLPCDMDAIKSITDAAGAMIIEDGAHALGATYPSGERVGSCQHSMATIFSLHPVKNIAAGEGGVITTNDFDFYKKLLRLRSHGVNKLDDSFLNFSQGFDNGEINPWYYEMQELGFHYRITDIQCGLALSQLKRLNLFVERRRKLVAQYDDAFRGFRNLRPCQTRGRLYSGHHIYPLRIDFENIGLTRRLLMQALKSMGIGTQVHYIPIPRHPYYANLGKSMAHLPEADKFYSEALTIPLFYQLTDGEQQKVINALSHLVG